MSNRVLRMKFAGRFIDLLGNQMYGGAVPAVAEFIANAWDADAEKVEITIPDDLASMDAQIIIRDYGTGMTFDEVNSYYLNIGYERRKLRGEKTSTKYRLVMGRKGIGKLAGFGIAENIIIRSVKDNHVIQFNLNYTELKSKEELNDFIIQPTLDEPCEEPSGVTIILKDLKLRQNINAEIFRKGLARRFALNSDEMKIIINDQDLTKEELEFEYKVPEIKENWCEEEIPNFGVVKYWFGFLKTPISDPELRGISIFARNRIAQFTPFFFNLSGGINGQVALEYLTGQVKADSLDEDEDYIATDRQSINWQLDKASLFEKWGQCKIKELCSDWKKRKDQRNLDSFKRDYSEFFPRINALTTQEKKDITNALSRIAQLENIHEPEFKIIANSIISGFERESVKKVIRRINSTDDSTFPELIEVINEWDIISAVSAAEVVFGKVEIIKQFKKHIEERLVEKAPTGYIDMQTFIQNHPWLLGYEYEHLTSADFHHEHGVDKWIEDVIIDTNISYTDIDKREDRRFDLLCIKNDWQIVILELMKPGKSADYDHVMRLNRYVTRIQTAIKDRGTTKEYRGKVVFGLLIADNFAKDSSLSQTLQDLRNNLDAISWDGLFKRVHDGYKDFLEILKMKAPEDPRIKGLINLD